MQLGVKIGNFMRKKHMLLNKNVYLMWNIIDVVSFSLPTN